MVTATKGFCTWLELYIDIAPQIPNENKKTIS